MPTTDPSPALLTSSGESCGINPGCGLNGFCGMERGGRFCIGWCEEDACGIGAGCVVNMCEVDGAAKECPVNDIGVGTVNGCEVDGIDIVGTMNWCGFDDIGDDGAVNECPVNVIGTVNKCAVDDIGVVGTVTECEVVRLCLACSALAHDFTSSGWWGQFRR